MESWCPFRGGGMEIWKLHALGGSDIFKLGLYQNRLTGNEEKKNHVR